MSAFTEAMQEIRQRIANGLPQSAETKEALAQLNKEIQDNKTADTTQDEQINELRQEVLAFAEALAESYPEGTTPTGGEA